MDFKRVFKPAGAPPCGKLALRAYLERVHLLVSYRSAFESGADRACRRRGVAGVARYR